MNGINVIPTTRSGYLVLELQTSPPPPPQAHLLTMNADIYSYLASIADQHFYGYYWSKPSVFKLVQLLSVQNRNELCNIGKYFKHALYIRSQYM